MLAEKRARLSTPEWQGMTRGQRQSWRQANQWDDRRRLDRQLRRYSLSVERYEAMAEAQGHRCAICKSPDPISVRWHIDHDRACCPDDGSCGSCVRALLCAHCNVGLAMFHDNPLRLSAAITYLEDRHGLSNGLPDEGSPLMG